MLLERLLERVELLLRVLAALARLELLQQVPLRLREEQPRAPVPLLAVVQRDRELLDLLVPVRDGELEFPAQRGSPLLSAHTHTLRRREKTIKRTLMRTDGR